MNELPQPPAAAVELARGASAVAPGVLLLHASRTIVAADIHLGYEDVIGAALPTWSTPEIVSTLMIAAQQNDAREIVLLGDVIHGTRMSEGAARAVREGLHALRAIARLTLVAGNHEGRTRGAAVLGETAESVDRDGWTLLHGDRSPSGAQLQAGRWIVGHLHPSLRLDASVTAPAFLTSPRVIAVPALTPYSGGLDVLSDDCLRALRPFGLHSRGEARVVAAAGGLLYPFGSLAQLRQLFSAPPTSGSAYSRRVLRPDT